MIPTAPRLVTCLYLFLAAFRLCGATEAPVVSPAEEAVTGMRLFKKPESGSELQTAELLYKRESDGVKVTLYGAVHVADEIYYKRLNNAFRAHQALLFELVADERSASAAQAAGRSRGGGGLGGAYQWVSDNLGLQYQLEGIDYSAPNFVHADLSPEGLAQAMAERGESVLTYAMKAMQGGMKAEQSGKGPNQADQVILLLGMLSGKPDGERMKHIFAKQLAASDETLAAIEGEKGSALIAARNEAALKVMEAQVAGGKRNLGIFYGAGHFPDFHKQMQAKGFKLSKTTWRAAWVMTHPKPKAKPAEENAPQPATDQPAPPVAPPTTSPGP